MNLRRMKVLYFFSILLIPLFLSCGKNESKSPIKNSFKADSLKLNDLYQKYQEKSNLNYDSSKLIYTKLIHEVNSLEGENKKLSILVYSNLTVPMYLSGYYRVADSLSSLAFSLAYKSGDEKYYDIAHKSKGNYHYLSGNIDSAKHHINKAIYYATKTNDIDQLVGARINQILLEQDNENYKKTISDFLEIIDLCEKHEKWQYMATACNNLGNRYREMGQLFTALKYFHKSIEIMDRINSKISKLNPLNNIAIIYTQLGMKTQALNQLKKVKDLASDTNNKNLYSLVSINIGAINYERKQYDSAISAIDSILAYMKDNNMPVTGNHILCLNYLGHSYFKKNDFSKSKSYYKKAISLSKSLGLNYHLGESYGGLSDIYLKEENYDSLYYYSSLNNDHSIKLNIPENIVSSYYHLAKTHEKQNNPKEALKNFNEYYKYAQSHFDTLTSQKTKDFAYSYEFQQKETEKILLQKENQLKEAQRISAISTIESQKIIIVLILVLVIFLLAIIFMIIFQSRKLTKLNDRLNEENDFKTNLFSIVSHDVRSPLVSLFSMFSLLKYNQIDEKDRERIENELLDRTEKTIDLIDNLLFWTREQLKGVKIKIELFDAKEIIDSISKNEHDRRAKLNITLINNIPESFIIESDKNIVQMLFRNLISNAFKFTPQNGKVEVFATVKGNEYIFSVCDNGVGIALENQGKLLTDSEIVSMKGLHGEKGKGFGLTLCNYFIQKCGGNLWFESKPGEGTNFHFSVPISVKI